MIAKKNGSNTADEFIKMPRSGNKSVELSLGKETKGVNSVSVFEG